MSPATTRSAARTATLAALPVALLVGVLAFWALGGFSGTDGFDGADGFSGGQPGRSQQPEPVPSTPVTMAAPPLAEADAAACRALVRALPAALRDRPRRAVTAGADQNAAYGQPPLTLACGTQRPSFPPDAVLAIVSGVCWYAQGESWTTVDRTVPVTVHVPAPYGPGGQWVVGFAPAIIETLPVAASLPFGCRG